jgi:trans-aconitate methyltransferase
MDLLFEWLENHKEYFSVGKNGYSGPPYRYYACLLPMIDRAGKLMDLGCGNGMLLKCALELSGHFIIPYGIDSEKECIKEAKTVLPSYSENLHVGDIRDYDFYEGPFDMLLTNPFHVGLNNIKNMQNFVLAT